MDDNPTYAIGRSFTATAVITRILVAPNDIFRQHVRVTLQETILYTTGQQLALPFANINHKKERQE